MRCWLVATLLAVAGFGTGSAASGQVLSAPDEVVIYVHKDLKDTDFVEGLICELSRVLAIPVRSDTSDLPLYRSYLAIQTQLDDEKVRGAFDQVTGEQGRSVFRYLVLPYDLKAAGLNYVFSSTSFGGSTGVVMSTIRLIPREAGLSRKRVSDITGDRIYKLMLKSVALLAGLRSEGCIMKFPRNLPELDDKPAEFCAEDRAALVAAHVLKDKPFGACNTVAMAIR
jgi:predicted Zn-dependent protease